MYVNASETGYVNVNVHIYSAKTHKSLYSYLYDFNFYTGKKMKTRTRFGESVVLNLAKPIVEVLATIYSPTVFFYIIRIGTDVAQPKILSCVTIRSIRE
jgi:hypothetical protein